MKKMAWLVAIVPIGAAVVFAQAPDAAAPGIKVTAYPNPVFVEQTATGQHVSMDLGVENTTKETLTLKALEVSVRDASGVLALRRSIDDLRRNTQYVPDHDVAPGKTLQIYNPLHLFEPALNLHTLEIVVRFASQDGQREHAATVVVHPVKYENKTVFTLPLEGRICVWDGHDLYAHHRRFDFLHPDLQKLGFTTNFQRYGYDLVLVNEKGEMNDGDPKRNETWFGFGKPVHATGPGTVAAVHDGLPDDRSFDPKEIAKRELAFGGNYVIVDHGNGEFSYYGHLKQNSVRVKVGERVERGQVLGAVGASGSSLFPHLHYELRDDLGDRKADGLPSYFHDFRRVLGARSMPVAKGALDTGEIVESR